MSPYKNPIKAITPINEAFFIIYDVKNERIQWVSRVFETI